MFGDKMLIGQFEVLLDDKARMFIPAKFDSEKGDALVLMYDAHINCYRIYNKSKIEEKFKQLDDLILSAKTEEELAGYKLIFFNFCKSILKECAVDSQNRISLGNGFVPREKLQIIGANDHAILERKKQQ